MHNLLERICEKVNCVEKSHDLLFKALVWALRQYEGNQGQREEPTGVHFIESGEALVINPNCEVNVSLSRCDAFGISDVIRRPGPEFFGDIRCGIKQVQTYYFPYSEFNKRLSTSERTLLSKMQGGMEERLEGVINYVSSKEKHPLGKHEL